MTYNDERPNLDDSSLESGFNEKWAKYVHDPSCSGNVSSTMTENSDVCKGEESLLEYSGIVCGNSESETSQDNNSTSESVVDEGEGSSYSGSDACSCHSVDNVEFDVDSISYDEGEDMKGSSENVHEEEDHVVVDKADVTDKLMSLRKYLMMIQIGILIWVMILYYLPTLLEIQC